MQENIEKIIIIMMPPTLRFRGPILERVAWFFPAVASFSLPIFFVGTSAGTPKGDLGLLWRVFGRPGLLGLCPVVTENAHRSPGRFNLALQGVVGRPRRRPHRGQSAHHGCADWQPRVDGVDVESQRVVCVGGTPEPCRLRFARRRGRRHDGGGGATCG